MVSNARCRYDFVVDTVLELPVRCRNGYKFTGRYLQGKQQRGVVSGVVRGGTLGNGLD